jgi:hypothetical protein
VGELLAKVAEILGAPETLGTSDLLKQELKHLEILLKKFYNHGLVEKQLLHQRL